MILARVLRPIVATQKDASLKNRKILVVQEATPTGEARGQTLVAVEADGIGAGPGDLVLIQREGGGARVMLGDDQAPVNAVVCGIVDAVHLNKD